MMYLCDVPPAVISIRARLLAILALFLPFCFGLSSANAAIGNNEVDDYQAAIESALAPIDSMTSSHKRKVAEHILVQLRASDFHYKREHIERLLSSITGSIVSVADEHSGTDVRVQQMIVNREIAKLPLLLTTFEILYANTTPAREAECLTTVRTFSKGFQDIVNKHFSDAPENMRDDIVDALMSRCSRSTDDFFTPLGKKPVDLEALQAALASIDEVASDYASSLATDKQTVMDDDIVHLYEFYLHKLMDAGMQAFRQTTTLELEQVADEHQVERVRTAFSLVNPEVVRISRELSQLREHLADATEQQSRISWREELAKDRLAALKYNEEQFFSETIARIDGSTVSSVRAQLPIDEQPTIAPHRTVESVPASDTQSVTAWRGYWYVVLICVAFGGIVGVAWRRHRSKRDLGCLLLLMGTGIICISSVTVARPASTNTDKLVPARISSDVMQLFRIYSPDAEVFGEDLEARSILFVARPWLMSVLNQASECDPERRKVLVSVAADWVTACSKRELDRKALDDRRARIQDALYNTVTDAFDDWELPSEQVSDIVSAQVQEYIAHDMGLMYLALWSDDAHNAITIMWRDYGHRSLPRIMQGYAYAREVVEATPSRDVFVKAYVEQLLRLACGVINTRTTSARTTVLRRSLAQHERDSVQWLQSLPAATTRSELTERYVAVAKVDIIMLMLASVVDLPAVRR